MPDRPWHRSLIRFVGIGMPEDQPDQHITSNMCVPVYTASEHPAGREPLHPSRPFPFPNCYQHCHVHTTVRVPTQLRDYRDTVSLPVLEIFKYYRYLDEDKCRKGTLLSSHGYSRYGAAAFKLTLYIQVFHRYDRYQCSRIHSWMVPKLSLKLST